MRVWNPANFSVAFATNATNATNAGFSTIADNSLAFRGKTQLGLGITGERWRNMTGSRAFNTSYFNSFSYPIMVFANTGAAGPSPYVEWTIDGLRTSIWYWQFNGAGAIGGGVTIVPPGTFYRANSNAGLDFWAEFY
jgi:hypothetical protein